MEENTSEVIETRPESEWFCMIIIRIFLTTIIIILSLFANIFVSNTNAKESISPDKLSLTPSASVFNSYEIFWPLVAGKTEGDSF